MKKAILLILLNMLLLNVFCFDFNTDNFSAVLDEETALFVYKDKIYILGYDGKLWSDSRPKKITNNYGYSVLHIQDNPYYGPFKKELKGLYLLDLNGDIVAVDFFENEKTIGEGRMVTGWKSRGDAWYYFTSEGYMLVNTVTPDGFRVGADGKFVGSDASIK